MQPEPFTLLMTVYGGDREEYVRDAFHSAVDDQTLRPDQVVLVQDGPVPPELAVALKELVAASPVEVTFVPLEVNRGLGPALDAGLQAHGVSAAAAHQASALPPVSILFAAFLSYNPIQHLIGAHGLAGVSAHDQAVLTGHAFFPHLISGPFRDGLHLAFTFAIVACLVAAAASLMRGGRHVHEEEAVAHEPRGVPA